MATVLYMVQGREEKSEYVFLKKMSQQQNNTQMTGNLLMLTPCELPPGYSAADISCVGVF